MKSVRTAVVIGAIMVAVASLVFGLLPFSAEVRVDASFFRVNLQIHCGPPLIELWGDQPCADQARDRATGAVLGLLIALAAGAAAIHGSKRPPTQLPPGGGAPSPPPSGG